MKNSYIAFCVLPFAFCLLSLTGCGLIPKAEAEAQSQSAKPPRGGVSTAVDAAIARTDSLQEEIEYIGTTRPVREVLLRSQVEGRLLKLNVDVGDAVKQGQILAQLDDALLRTALNQAQAELAARQSEVARAQAQVSNARTQLERTRMELQQAQTDAARNASLGQTGAISRQQAELAVKEANTARQAVLSAQEQIRTEQQAVAAARGRVAAQQAVVAQNRERLSYALLASPIAGVVLEKVSEPGNLVQPGSEVLKLGDFSRVKVMVPLSELELANVRVGQSVRVQLDAFENQSFSGEVSRISPAADPTARQLPVEVTIPNSNGKIGSGLLARVTFSSEATKRVVVPQTALEAAGEPRNRGAGKLEGRGAEEQKSRRAAQNAKSPGTVFVVTGEGEQAKVAARSVVVGDRANGKAEILSGLKPGERYVVRSGKPLKDGEPVRLSALSETRQPKGQ